MIRLQDQHPDQQVVVFFQDECRFGQQGTLTRGWAKRGSRPTAVRQTEYEYVWVIAAASPQTGKAEALTSFKVFDKCYKRFDDRGLSRFREGTRMLPSGVLDKSIERCPAAVMVRGTVERLLRPERLDEIFETPRSRQYERQIVCSELVALMVGVATRTHQSVHAAYLAAKKTLGVSAAAVYGKLRCFEPRFTAALVRDTAVEMSEVIAAMPRGRREVLPGREVFYLDGNHLAATEHRLEVLRTTRAGPLPGQTLALLDAQSELVVELVPCECGHAQERSLLPELLERIRAETVIVADRNFCTTKFLFGLFRRGAFFLIRQHGQTLAFRCEGRRRQAGRCETGTLYEQTLVLSDSQASEGQESELKIRRITLQLDSPTEAGDREIHLLTNLPPKVRAKRVAETYRLRWTIEGAFQTLTDVLRCEVETLGYPRRLCSRSRWRSSRGMPTRSFKRLSVPLTANRRSTPNFPTNISSAMSS